MGLAVILVCTVAAWGCNNFGGRDEEVAKGPLQTARALLEAHDLLGKLPSQRSPEKAQKEVAEETLRLWIQDVDKFDPFIAKLYVGFVLGALANHQDRLSVEQTGSKATIHAGSLPIRLVKEAGTWRISLAYTIPDEIAKRAEKEKARVMGAARPVTVRE